MSSEYMIFYSTHSMGINDGSNRLVALRAYAKHMKARTHRDDKIRKLISAIIKLDNDAEMKKRVLLMTVDQIHELETFDRDVSMTWRKIFLGYDWHIVRNSYADKILPVIDPSDDQLVRFR